VARAGVRTARPSSGPATATLAVPGNVEPNAYEQVVVRSVAGGQVSRVTADLGTQVKRGDLLATIHTPDLADTTRVYRSMQSELEAAHQRLQRLESLVKIGAASQQELEMGRAEHMRHTTDVESARARLILLGVSPDRIASLDESAPMDSTLRVASPSDGVITARAINTGANIDASADLFTVTNLASVWIVASVYERDFGRIQPGTRATISPVSPGRRSWTGRVTYIDPQLDPATRTAKVRVEVDNPGGVLQLGMYVDVVLHTTKTAAGIVIPRGAVQTIGDQTVVYVADPNQQGRFVERSVALGPATGLDVEILAGITASDEVVVAGSFALRAERDRLGLPPPASLTAPAPPPIAPRLETRRHRVEIIISKEGFTPATVNVDARQPFDLVFIRRTDDTCAKEVVVPSLNVRRPLPLNEPVTISVPAREPGPLAFDCGMNMLHGTVVVR
jgi:RND family efflux transporter MFP subunit